MKNFKSLIFFIIIILIISNISCEKEVRPLSIRELTVIRYKTVLDSLNLNCPSEKTENYFTALIGVDEACYYDGVDGLSTRMDKVVSFTTSSPSFNTNTTYSDAANYFRFGILRSPGFKSFEDLISFTTPKYLIGSDSERFLDSLFAIKEHKIREKEDEFDKFLISLELYHPGPDSSFMGLHIRTHFGPQEGSKLIINSVRKFREGEDLYYDLDISLNCTLYHWPQTGKTGIWGKIENGHLHARFKPEFYN
ncbi:MAG: hypothetical protein RLZZ546_861 [Bacteroidota bacterium]